LPTALRPGEKRVAGWFLARSVPGATAVVVVVRDAARGGRHTALLLVCGKPFAWLSRYFREKNISLSRERAIARATSLLIDFIAARGKDFSDPAERRNLYNAFAHDLTYGTIRNAEDPTGLWWLPRSSDNVATLLDMACDFSDWLVRTRGTTELNPYRVASHAERIIFWRAWNQHKYKSLLAHIKDPEAVAERAAVARTFASPKKTSALFGRPPYFPHDRFDELLLTGFARRGRASGPIWQRLNLRDMMVALLLHAGGVRVSEPFHLWVHDVFADPHDPSMSVVRIYHPSDGAVSYRDPSTSKWVSTNRAAYLQLMFGRQPLNDETPHNGWKGNLLRSHGKYMPIVWHPSIYGRLFLTLFKLYINHVRPIGLNHPWLFVNEQGEPFTAKAYSKRHDSAVARIGLEVAKPLGTTPHGHRHSYGQRIQDAKDAGFIDTKGFKVVMHHRSDEAQQTYGERDFKQINESLTRAATMMAIPSPASVEALVNA
jgi:hypothetical protein